MSTRIIKVENENFTISLPKSDLLSIIEFYKISSLNLVGSKILITGATGFVASHLVDALHMLNAELNLGIEIYLNSRNLSRYAQQISQDKKVKNLFLVEGNIAEVRLPRVEFSHVIHAATPTIHNLRTNEIADIEKASVDGLSNIISQVVLLNKEVRILNLSSGAADINVEVNGKETSSLQSVYGRAKFASEKILESGHSGNVPHGINARLFAFYGPRLPLGDNYAIGNFMRDAWIGNQIKVNGSGESIRSYMHTTDLTSKLLYLICQGDAGTFNIGSSVGHTIKYWAELISNHFDVPLLMQGAGNTRETTYVSPLEQRIPVGPNENSSFVSLLESWYRWIDVNFKKSDFS
jgi:nucleoside-diphosphate-sugar epimerase